MDLIIENNFCTFNCRTKKDREHFKEIREYLAVELDYFAQKAAKFRYTHFHFLSDKTGKVATGFLPLIFTFCEEELEDVKFNIEDNRTNKLILSKKSTYQVAGKILRPYQKESVDLSVNCTEYGKTKLEFFRGIYNIATNGGKTFIMAGIINKFQNAKVIITVSNTILFNQHYKDFQKFFPDKKIGYLKSGANGLKGVDEKGNLDCDIFIVMVRTLNNKLKSKKRKEKVQFEKLIANFNLCFLDEGHEIGRKEYITVIDKLNCYGIYSFSGTALKGSSTIHKLKRISRTGSTLKTIPKKFLQDNGYSLKTKVFFYLNNTSENLEIQIQPTSWQEQTETYIYQSGKLLNIVCSNILDKIDKNILVSFYDIQNGQGQRIKRKLIELGVDTFSMVYIDGNTKAKDKDRLIDSFKSDGAKKILIASTTVKTGLNMPKLEHLEYLQGGKCQVAVSQINGRLERLYETEQQKELNNNSYTTNDYFHTGKHTSNHSRERLDFYLREGFEVHVKENCLPYLTAKQQAKVKVF